MQSCTTTLQQKLKQSELHKGKVCANDGLQEKTFSHYFKLGAKVKTFWLKMILEWFILHAVKICQIEYAELLAVVTPCEIFMYG